MFPIAIVDKFIWKLFFSKKQFQPDAVLFSGTVVITGWHPYFGSLTCMLKMWRSSQLKKSLLNKWIGFFVAQFDIGVLQDQLMHLKACCIFKRQLFWSSLVLNIWTVNHYHFSCLGLTTFLLSIYQEPMQLDITEVEHCLTWRLRCLTWRLQVIFHFSKFLTTFFLSGLNTDLFFPQNGTVDTGGRKKNDNVEGKKHFPCVFYIPLLF